MTLIPGVNASVDADKLRRVDVVLGIGIWNALDWERSSRDTIFILNLMRCVMSIIFCQSDFSFSLLKVKRVILFKAIRIANEYNLKKGFFALTQSIRKLHSV